MAEVGGDGGGGEVMLYVAKRLAPWTRVMGSTMAQLETLLLSYPPEQYIYGIKDNHGQGAMHEVILNGWNGKPPCVLCNTLPDGRRPFGYNAVYVNTE